jgi:porin
MLRTFFLAGSGLYLIVSPGRSQSTEAENLSGADRHELTRAQRKYLFGDWAGRRSQLEELGVAFDLRYISDSLWNVKSDQPERLAMWNRVRGTMDMDLGRLIHRDGWYFHATALWQGGAKSTTVRKHYLGCRSCHV